MKKILIHLDGGIGDMIILTPVIASLAKAGHTIDLLVEKKSVIDVFKSWSLVNFLTNNHADVESDIYDYYFMTRFVINPVKFKNRSKTVMLCASCPPVMSSEISDVNTYFTYAKFIEPDLEIQYETYCGHSSRVFPEISKKTVILYPGCDKYYASKRWGKFDVLANRFDDVAVVGTEEDMDLSHSYFYPGWIRNFFSDPLHYDGLVTKAAHLFGKRYNCPFKFGKHVKNYIGQLNLADTAALIKQAGLLIGNDGGITHMAAALDIPTVAIFGPTSITTVKVNRKNILYLSKNLDCQPCQFGGKYPKAWRHGYVGCPIGMKCLTDISVDEVYQKALIFANEQK